MTRSGPTTSTHISAIDAEARPRFTVPSEPIVRKGERGDAVFFIVSGAAEVFLPDRRAPFGSSDLFSEMALLTGEPRQADVRALTYWPELTKRPPGTHKRTG